MSSNIAHEERAITGLGRADRPWGCFRLSEPVAFLVPKCSLGRNGIFYQDTLRSGMRCGNYFCRLRVSSACQRVSVRGEIVATHH